MKFSKKTPAIHRNCHEYQLWDLRQEFERLLAQDYAYKVAKTYLTPCQVAKHRINKLKDNN